MRHGSLFSGIGGFDLAAEWMGWENVFHCEWNLFGQRVLKYYWPKSESFSDITKSCFKKYNGAIEIISGGFPCQPYSQAGKRKGKADDRHLWPEMLRAIREIQPRWVVGENVSGLLNWNGGLVLDEITADLEAAGFEIFPPLVLPACSVNAPHRRDRVWIIAYSVNNRHKAGRKKETETDRVQGISRQTMDTGEFDRTNISSANTGSNGDGFNRSNGQDEINPSKGRKYALNDVEQIIINNPNPDRLEKDEYGFAMLETEEGRRRPFTRDNAGTPRTSWDIWPTQPPVCIGNDGFPTELDGITLSKWRQESIKGYGNAVVPQVPFEIFKAIEHYENTIQ